MNVIQALEHPQLLGAIDCFKSLDSWRNWLVFLKALDGLPLDSDELPIFTRFTGRETYNPPPGGFPEAVVVVGRQAAKSRIAATYAAWSAIRPASGGGSGEWVICLAQDFQASKRALFGYISEAFSEDGGNLMSQAVVNRTQETIALNSGVTVACYACRPTAVRGVRARLIALDEFAFLGSADGRDVSKELLSAARPCLAMTGGKLLILSSPGGMSGALWSLYSDNFGESDATTLVWQAASYEMNPCLPQSYLDRMRADPEAWDAEVGGKFRTGSAALLDDHALSACVVSGRRELEPSACRGKVVAFYDPSGGRKDRAALAVGFRDKDSGRVVVAALRAWASPHNPATVAAEAATVAKSYGCQKLFGDAYSGDTIASLVRAEGLAYERCSKSASDLLMDLLPVVQSGALELPDVDLGTTAAELVGELRAVERRPGGAGRDRADVPRSGSRAGHGDLAVATAGLCWALPTGKRVTRVSGAGLSAAQPLRPRAVGMGSSGWSPWPDSVFEDEAA